MARRRAATHHRPSGPAYQDPHLNREEILKRTDEWNLPGSDASAGFIEDELDMQMASGRTGFLRGWKLPNDVSRHDFFALVAQAEKFAAEAGWQYFPTPAQLIDGLRHGFASRSEDENFEWFASYAPGLLEKKPWLRSGMTKREYQDKIAAYADTIQEEVGDRLGDSNIWTERAAREHWSVQRLRTEFLAAAKQDPRYGWLKHGMNYSQWQQYKVDNKQQAITRYGVNGETDANFMQQLDDPLVAFSAGGGAIRQQQGTSTGPAEGGQSPVR